MEANAGMSIKDRLALLQANNKNPQLSGPMKAPAQVPPKPTAIPSSSSPANKSFSGSDNKPNGPLVALKPTIKPAGDLAAGNAKENSSNNSNNGPPQVAFKLRPTGTQHGVSPVVALKPKVSDTGGVGGVVSPTTKSNTTIGGTGIGATSALTPKPNNSFNGTVTSFVSKKPAGSGGVSSGDTAGTSSVALRDKSNANAGPRPPSIQERMAALRQKAGADSSATSPTTTGIVSSGGGAKSPDPASKMVPLFPAKAADGLTGIKPSDLVKSLHDAAKRKKAGDVFLIRNSDGKRFRRVAAASVKSSDPAPAKPPVPENVDLVSFLQAYATAKEAKLKTDSAQGDTTDSAAAAAGTAAAAAGGAGEGEMDELYVQAESEIVPLRIKGRGSVKRATSHRVSEIPEFTEEEEEQELYTDGVSAEATAAIIPEGPEEEYDDCASAAAMVESQWQDNEFEEPDEIYEPLDEELDSEPMASPGPADDKKAGKKEKEKEKEGKKDKKKDKTKDDTNKKEEKERKKKEEEIKKQRAKFGLKEGEEKLGEGVVKNNASGGVFTKDLAVSKGEMVSILRMDNNPSGKWLVQNEQGKFGFVSSSNIEVATLAIRQILEAQAQEMMTAATMGDSLPGDDEAPDELYEPLPDGEMDDIYEEL